MENREGAGTSDGSGHGLTRFGGGEKSSGERPVDVRDGSAAFNFATRNGSPVFVNLSKIEAVQEITLHDANGKKGTVLVLASGKEVETTTPLASVLGVLGW
jgi:hypothetical protein